MNRILKWLTYLVLCVVGMFALLLFLANIYKKEILAEINVRLKETVNGEVSIGDYDITFLHRFPHLTISLIDIRLHGPRYEIFHKPFLKAEKISVNLEVLKLISKDLSIRSVDVEHGDLFVFRTIDGYTNAEVFKTRKAPGRGSTEKLAVIDLRQINLNDIHVNFQDSLKNKSFGVHFVRTENMLSLTKEGSAIRVTGNMTFEGLLLNPAKGRFLRNKNALADLNMELDGPRKHLRLNPSTLIFDQSTIVLSGAFELDNTSKFQLEVTSDRMNYQEALTILADSISKRLGRFVVEKPVKVKVNINGHLQPGVKPAVDVVFSFEDSKINSGKVAMTAATVEGKFMNHFNAQLPNDDTNAQLYFSKVKGKVNGLPVEAVLTLNNLKDPFMDLKATFKVNLIDLNENFDSTQIKLLDGVFVSNFTYSGRLREYLDESVTSYEGRLNGQASITHGRFQYNRKQIRVNNLEAQFGFTEKQFSINSLSFQINKNDVLLKGNVSDFIPFFVNPKSTGKVKLAISSPKFDMTGMLKPRNTSRSSKSSKAKSKKKMADMIDRLNEELDFDLDFDVKEFVNAKFKATQMKGKLFLANDQFLMKNVAMNFAGGRVAMDLKVDHLKRKNNPIQIDAKIKNVGLKQFFYCFNDFNQTTFRHEHIDGNLDLDLKLNSDINEKFELSMPNLTATAKFNIRDGSLKNFEPMQRLSNFLLKGRDFSDVQFSDVGTEITMQGTRMDVSRMEIESTVLTMFIEGKYDLIESSDLSIQVPLSNLKKRDQDIAPENIGVDAKVGASVFLRVKPDKNGKTAITYDPFKKLRKKKKGEKSA